MTWLKRAYNTLLMDPYELAGWQEEPHIDEPAQRGMYHVTTDLPAVIQEGLKSQEQLGREEGADPVSGLGGAAGDMISLTYSYEKALNIQQALQMAAETAQGKLKTSDVVRWVEDFRSTDEATLVLGILSFFSDSGPGVSPKQLEQIYETKGWLEMLSYLDRIDIGAMYQYGLLSQLDFKVSENRKVWDVPDLTHVGFVASWENAQNIDPEKIGIVQVAAKPGALQHHYEYELTLAPEDAEVLGPVTERGLETMSWLRKRAYKAGERYEVIEAFEATKFPGKDKASLPVGFEFVFDETVPYIPGKDLMLIAHDDAGQTYYILWEDMQTNARLAGHGGLGAEPGLPFGGVENIPDKIRELLVAPDTTPIYVNEKLPDGRTIIAVDTDGVYIAMPEDAEGQVYRFEELSAEDQKVVLDYVERYQGGNLR
jgi:hypothetical protein